MQSAPAAESSPEEPPSSITPSSPPIATDTSWQPPLPPLSLTPATDADKERIRACVDDNRVQQVDVTSRELMSAAACLGQIPQPGHEIRIYKHLLATMPDAPEAVDAARALGLRLEQIDVREPAITAYHAYLRRWPTQADARSLGQRAVCLARSLGDDARTDELLRELERLYARRGFTRPDSSTLDQLCPAASPDHDGS